MPETKDVGMFNIPRKTQKKEEPSTSANVKNSSSSSSSSTSPNPIIEDSNIEVKSEKQKAKGNCKGLKSIKNEGGLTINHKVSDLFIKIYSEQLPAGIDAFCDCVKNISKDEMHVAAILHDKDLHGDEVFAPAVEKPHFHIFVYIPNANGRDGAKNRKTVSSIMNKLGIVWRPEDELIWKKRGVERMRDVGRCALYLTHENEEDQKANKYLYDRTEIVANISDEELNQYREGYLRLSEQKKRVNLDEQIELLDVAYKEGYKLTPYRVWRDSIPYTLRKSSSMKEFEKQFDFGRADRIEKEPTLTKLAVFIQGEANEGKTYASLQYFIENEKSPFIVGIGGGSGKFDALDTKHDAIIIDDATVGNILELADNRISRPYRRNSKNGVFCGNYLIITSNQSFDDWVERCGVVDDMEIEAAKSRFFICQVVESNGHKFLDVISRSTRGTLEEQKKRIEMFFDFKKYVDKTIDSYKPKDYEKEVDEYYKMMQNDSISFIDATEEESAIFEVEKNGVYAVGDIDYLREAIGDSLDEECLPFDDGTPPNI